MPTLQRIYPRLNTNALSFVRRTAGALGAWTQTSAVYSGQGARYAGLDQGAAQVGAVPAFNAVANGAIDTLLIAQVLTDPLREQLIAAGTWNVGFAARLANAGATYTWEGRAALFVVNGLTGARRATIFDITAIGGGSRTSTGERTVLGSVAGAAAQVRVGDFLCLEFGIAVTNSAASLVPQASVFADGTAPITSDDVAATSALSVLESPQVLYLSLPQAGEQPSASVNHAQAVKLLKDCYPPDSGGLYDWDNPDAIVCKLFEAWGDVIKLYGYDQADRLFREISPLTCVELLPTWEALLGITLSDTAARTRSIAQRRAQVIARLREKGPLTLFNLAGIFVQLASYAAGTRPDVLELSYSDMRAANVYSDTVSAAVPTGTGFDGTNLVRYTPTLLDGGAVWGTGAQVTLNLSGATSAGLRIRLTGPDLTVADWEGGPDLASMVVLRSPAHAGKAIHGPWKLNIYRPAGSPAVDLESWQLYVLGKNFGGRAQAKFNWAVFLDAAHQSVDRRDIQSTLDRITQSYAQSFCLTSLTSEPGTGMRAGRFVTGA